MKVFNRGINTYDVQVGNLFGQAAISNNTTHVCTNISAAAIWHAQDYVKFDENAITLSCTKDQNATNHTYPRRTDPTFDQWLPISNVSGTGFDVHVGKSGINDVYDHTFVAFASNGLKRQTGTITLDVGDGAISNSDAHTFISATSGALVGGGQYNHNFVASGQHASVTDASYNPTTGWMTLTVPNHGFMDGESIQIANNSLVFTCLQDSNATEHSYPRTSDPVSGEWIRIYNTTDDTFDVKVLDEVPSTNQTCLLYTSPSPRDRTRSRMPSSA